MSTTEGLSRGMVIRHGGQLYTVLDFRVVQTGKQKPTVHVKLRSMKTGHAAEHSRDELGKIEEVATEVRQMQYLYASAEGRVFMDTETFEQYPLGDEVLDDALNFLVEQEVYRVQMIEGQPVFLQLPQTVVLAVVDTAPVEHAGGSSSVYKEARLASGLVVHVPLFIKNGDRIRIKADTREYQGKEH